MTCTPSQVKCCDVTSFRRQPGAGRDDHPRPAHVLSAFKPLIFLAVVTLMRGTVGKIAYKPSTPQYTSDSQNLDGFISEAWQDLCVCRRQLQFPMPG
jgi:hypothetical protein